MSIAQTYILVAAEGKEAALLMSLKRMAAAVRPLAGCESVTLMQEQENPRRCIFIETFTNAEAHKASAGLMPKDILTALMATLDGKPDGSTYHLIPGA